MLSTYTNCDHKRCCICVENLKVLCFELSLYHRNVVERLDKCALILKTLRIHAVKLDILKLNCWGNFAMYDQLAVEFVSKKLRLNYKQSLANLQHTIKPMSAAYKTVCKAYDNFMESTKKMDWMVNIAFIQGNAHLESLQNLIESARNIVFYFKIFQDNMLLRLHAILCCQTGEDHISNLKRNLKIPNDFLGSLNAFLKSSENQITAYEAKINRFSNDGCMEYPENASTTTYHIVKK